MANFFGFTDRFRFCVPVILLSAAACSLIPNLLAAEITFLLVAVLVCGMTRE